MINIASIFVAISTKVANNVDMTNFKIYTSASALTLFVVAAPFISPFSARAQSGKSLPAAKHGQPAWSFSGGKRLSSQEANPTGMHDYSGPGAAASTGTGIQEIGPSGVSTVSPANAPVKIVPTVPISKTMGGQKFLTGNKNGAVVALPKHEAKPATTVVQLLGPDGKMQYKEVPFMGELSANKRAPNITDVKDGEGKVKEYDWVKKKP